MVWLLRHINVNQGGLNQIEGALGQYMCLPYRKLYRQVSLASSSNLSIILMTNYGFYVWFWPEKNVEPE